MDSTHYCSTLTKLRKSIKSKRWVFFTHQMILLHDNARLNVVRETQTNIKKKFRWEVLEHPVYCPDLSHVISTSLGLLREHYRGKFSILTMKYRKLYRTSSRINRDCSTVKNWPAAETMGPALQCLRRFLLITNRCITFIQIGHFSLGQTLYKKKNIIGKILLFCFSQNYLLLGHIHLLIVENYVKNLFPATRIHFSLEKLN